MVELEKRYSIPHPSPGTIYPILTSLKKSGLIKSIGEGKRDKKLYSITEKGLKYLEEHKEELREALELVEKFKEFSNLGGRELAKVVKDILDSIDKLSEEQKEALAFEISEFTRRVRLILLGEIPRREKDVRD
ncbi:Hypothetical protein, possibly a transcriptional regulator [Pyrococcus abyssi GE5]|nr:Hypothetical protein, possibly a transcriptional regulator [Pyrococcus abyssi GE5]